MKAGGYSPAPELPRRASHWASIAEAGSSAGMLFLLGVYRVFGRGVFRALLVPAMAWYFLRRRTAREASQEYLRRVYLAAPDALGAPPGLRTSFRHFLSFGESMLDKLVAWSGGLAPDCVEVVDPVEYKRVHADKRGRLFIGSHFGNLEFCRGFANQHRDVRINVLIHDSNAANFRRAMTRVNPASSINLFQVSELDVPTVLSLKGKIEQGEWLIIAGDRVPVDSTGRTLAVDFLGAPALFPIGPYVLAATLQCPVTLLFAYRDGERVKVAFEAFADPVILSRAEREAAIRQYAQRFAQRLAAYCALQPLQWFNFFPFWGQPGSLHK